MKTFHYPLADIFGTNFCFAYTFAEMVAAFISQFHTFFLTLFRFICLFRENWLLTFNITPRVSRYLPRFSVQNSTKFSNFSKTFARVVVALNWTIPFIIGSFLMMGSEHSRTLNTCLGVLDLRDNGISLCTLGTKLNQCLCKAAYGIYIIISSNMLDALMLYPCFIKIHKQNEDVKEMIGERHYTRRRK